jgi:N6-adenosine-specific RNA methylase IME4
MQRDEKKAQRVAERRRAIEDTAARNAVLPVGERTYRVIYADPPWSYQNTPSPDVVTPDCHYPLMTIDDIAAMPISRMAMDDAVLFLWVPSPLLVEGLRVCQDWGFVYKAMFVWDKVKHNMGHYNSVRHELLFVCTRGSCMPDRPQLLDSVVSIERTEHSRKPDEFRAIIDALYPDGPRIELFARTVPTGWDVFGNEV